MYIFLCVFGCLFLCEMRSFLEDVVCWIGFLGLFLFSVSFLFEARFSRLLSLRQLRLTTLSGTLPTRTMHFPSHRLPRRPFNCLHSEPQTPTPRGRQPSRYPLLSLAVFTYPFTAVLFQTARRQIALFSGDGSRHDAVRLQFPSPT